MGTERILLVEDDVPLAAAEKELLEGLGYKVTAMKCGVEALEIIKTVPDRFDIIITDFTMPRMTGVPSPINCARARPARSSALSKTSVASGSIGVVAPAIP